jgi:ribosomal protein RSM22 (predicted rRNA methylase)
MKLPSPLADAIEAELSRFDRKALARAVDDLSTRYQSQPENAVASASVINKELECTAYLVTRLPATYAAIRAVLRELEERMPALEVRSLLDLGAGPGTAMWAAADIFHGLEQMTLIERSSSLIRLGKNLAESSPSAVVQNAHWVEADLARECQLPENDLVVISYALGELGSAGRSGLMVRAWQAAAKILAVIEPGTPRGFEIVLVARDALLEQKAHLVAPCPHEKRCPMDPQGRQDPLGVVHLQRDWCHFAQRLERTSLHRRLKAGELGYEDEKFSYIVAAKHDVVQAAARVIRHPIQLKGHIKLELCTETGLEQQTITRSQGETFKAARRVKWGEAWKHGPE